MDFSRMLNKVMRRTELNVAVAGAMIGSVSSMAKLFPVMEKWTKLNVYFNDGNGLAWLNAPWNPNVPAWRDFIKWYHGRPQSECYVMYTDDGLRMFLRKDIRGYQIENGERVKKETTE